MPQQHVTTHYRTQRLCRVLQALGKARNTLGNKGHTAKKLTTKCSLHSAICRALGKAFAECRKTLGKEKHSEKNPRKNSKKKLFNRGRHPPANACPVSIKVASHGIFRAQWDSNCELSLARPPLPLHPSLTCVYIAFFFPTYYNKPSVNWLFEALNEFKWKSWFFRSTTFILIVYSSEVIYKIWISNLKTSDVFFRDKMILNKKIVNYKVS